MNRVISPVHSLNGSVQAPPDKSIAQRAALFSLLTDKESVICNYPQAADPQTALLCIKSLGAKIARRNGNLIITGTGRAGLPKNAGTIDCGNSGTTMRLLAGILAGSGTGAILTGDTSLSKRTMKRIIDPLRKMGAEIRAAEGDVAPLQFLPGNPLTGIDFELPVASAQLKSCILLAGLFTDATTVIETVPSRNHTEKMLNLRTEQKAGGLWIHTSRDHPVPVLDITIPGDFSSAAFWLVAGAIYPGSKIVVKGTGLNNTRSGALEILKRMGADITIENEFTTGSEPIGDLRVVSSALKPTIIQPEEIPNCIDELPVLAVAMAFADGVSVFRGAAELRHKECDRIDAVARLLRSAGVAVTEFDDGLEIHGNPGLIPKPALFNSYHDHRIAMASAIIAGRGSKESAIEHAEAVNVSYAEFWNHFDKLAGRG
ncbi:MAG: 3-phosphoshikimate 1-carboxyvinyltransferase [Rhodothermaceae bacterium]|nr:3-phosphoshikimate 1-carboxyvinyltransferase [Rhodothermaceae bacterium]